MSFVKHHKVIASLPATLEPDAFYVVRAGLGFDFYTTSHGPNVIAHKVNSNSASSINITREDIYEYREIWAEESSAISSNAAEYSYGNGASGNIGIPNFPDTRWEVVAMYFNADNFADGSSVTVACYQFLTSSSALSNEVCTITLNDPTDGGGQANHAYKVVEYDPPKPLPHPNTAAPIGFYTKSVTGTISDVRVGVRLRRKIGEAVTNVEFS